MAKVKTLQRASRAGATRRRREQGRYLAGALETGGPKLFLAALANVVRAEGEGRVAGIAGISRRALARTFSKTSRAEIAAMLELIQASGLKLKLVA